MKCDIKILRGVLSAKLAGHFHEALRFLAVGGANFVLTFLLFYSLFRIWKIDYSVALLVSWAVGMIFTYVFNFLWVFRPDGAISSHSRVAKYITTQVVSIGLNILTLRFVVETFGFDAFYVQCALIPAIVLFNYAAAKFWSLRRNTN